MSDTRSESPKILPPNITILADHPIGVEADQALEDAFELESKLGGAFDVLRHKNTQMPVTVALYGSWGSGKSSGMRWLQRRLEAWSNYNAADRKGHFRARTIWFEPWKYQTREDVWRGLISEVILAAITAKNASITTVANAAKQFGLFLGRSFVHTLSSIKLKASAANIGPEAEVDLAAIRRIVDDYKDINHPEKAYLNEFETTFRDWVEDSLDPDERLIIFIDDLDRCLPKVTLEVLEALKLYLSIPQLAFVVGLDRGVVDSVVSKEYKDMGVGDTKSKEYLDKLFQVEIQMAPSELQMGDYLSQQIAFLDTSTEGLWSKMFSHDSIPEDAQEIVETQIERLCRSNPRESKRLLNSCLFSAEAARKFGAKQDEAPEALAFIQGASNFLIQRVLQRVYGHERAVEMLNRKVDLDFFEDWSKNLEKLADAFRQDAPAENDEQIRKSGAKGPSFDVDAAIRQEFIDRCPIHGTERMELEKEDPLWDLLKIPFSKAVASAAIIAVSENTAAQTSPSPSPFVDDSDNSDVDLPAVIKRAIARSLNIEVDQLNESHWLNIQTLDLSGANITDTKPLAQLQNLTVLDLSKNQISNAEPLAQLQNLTVLYLYNNQISNTEPFAQLQNLTKLFLSGNLISNAKPLAQLQNLTTLFLSDNQISNVEPLAQLQNLTVLNLNSNQISNTEPLTQLQSLTVLDLSDTGVEEEQIGHLREMLPNTRIVT